MAKIGDTNTPVYVGEKGQAVACQKSLHTITVEDKGDPNGKLLAEITINGTVHQIHDKAS